MADEQLTDWDAEDAPSRPYEAAYGYMVYFPSKYGYGARMRTFDATRNRAIDNFMANCGGARRGTWAEHEGRGYVCKKCVLAPMEETTIEPKTDTPFEFPGQYSDEFTRPDYLAKTDARAGERIADHDYEIE